MTYRQLLEEGRVHIVQTATLPFYYWNVCGEKKLLREPYDWEDAMMTWQEACKLHSSLWNVPFVRIYNHIDTIQRLAVQEDPNDTRSINERKAHERMLQKYRPQNNNGLFKSLLPNILIGIPLMIIRSALKH